MKLTDFVVSDAIVPDLAAQDRNAAMSRLIQALVDAGQLAKADHRAVVDAMIERERTGSTGFGKGVAVPHVKHLAVKRLMAAVGVSERGIDFKALDDGPVFVIILVLCPTDQPDEHLQAMEVIFSHLQDQTFRRDIRQAADAAELARIIEQADAHRQLA